MSFPEKNIRVLLRLPVEERIRAAKLLLESLDERARAAKLLLDSIPPAAHQIRTVSSSPACLDSSRSGLAHGTAPYPSPGLTGSDIHHGELESDDDELADLDELAADQEGLRAAVRAAVQAELEPLHELTSLLRRFAELARTTGHALRARAA